MLRIRLQRRGKKNFATYRVVVAEQSAPVKGKFVADLGWYNPHTNEFKVESEKLTAWLDRGAKPSDTIHNLLVTHGLLKANKVIIWRAKKAETTPEAAAASPVKSEPK